ncbi:MAG: FGGY family carbohydrate kinase, partial [Oscillospiraceae bacterium]|nr:FGGY family carbohydrate kinase [Oscillospiraceae bacterium]
MNDLFLGIDIGTSGTKSLVMDKSGGVVASAAVLYDYDTPQNGWTEQHPDLWWDATVKTVGEVCRKVGAKNIKGVGFSGQMHGLVMLDEHDRVIRPALLWNDQRTGDEVEEIKNIIGEQRLIELIANPIPTGFTAPKILWVRNHEPENYKKCAKIMLPKDYIRYKLTGVHGSDVSDASGMG